MQAINDYINGNLTDAKRRAKQAGRKRLIEALREEYGYSAEVALAIVAYLLDGGSFQAAADAEHAGVGYQPKTGAKCFCRPGMERDNCPQCEGTGWRIDFAAIRARK